MKQSLYRSIIVPEDSQEVKAPTLEDSRHMMMVSFSVLRTDHLYP